ncbi:MAG: Hsp20/alpha crystallin family protein [Nitrososphaerales archaeon]
MSLWRKRFFSRIREIEEEIDRATEELFREIKEEELRRNYIIPLYNIRENEREYIISIDIPGVNKEDINLELQKDKLILEGPCNIKLPSGRGNCYKLAIELTEPIEPEKVRARYKNGVLEISILKKAEERRKIRIE